MAQITVRDLSTPSASGGCPFPAQITLRDDLRYGEAMDQQPTGDIPSRTAQATLRDVVTVEVGERAASSASGTLRDGFPFGGSDDSSDELFNRFRLGNPLSYGAEATLFLAESPIDRVSVVIKIYRTGVRPDPLVLARISEISVSHLVRVYEHGELASGRYYEVIEYFKSGTLRRLLHSAARHVHRRAHGQRNVAVRQPSGRIAARLFG